VSSKGEVTQKTDLNLTISTLSLNSTHLIIGTDEGDLLATTFRPSIEEMTGSFKVVEDKRRSA
jgi:hypothetical protein